MLISRSLFSLAMAILSLFMLWGFSAPTMAATFDIQLYGGMSHADWEYEALDQIRTKSLSSVEAGLSMHLSPFPKAPLSFGIGIQTNKFDSSATLKAMATEDPGEGEDGNPLTYERLSGVITGTTYGPEVMTWIPIRATKHRFKPFLRVGYVFGAYRESWNGAMTDSGQVVEFETKTNFNASGLHYSIGLIYSPTKAFGVVVEYSMNQLLLEGTDQTITVATTNGSQTAHVSEDGLERVDRNRSLNASVFRLGANFAIGKARL